MEFKIVIEIDTQAEKKVNIINSLSNEINYLCQTKDYGTDIEFFFLKCICIKTKKGYEDWYKSIPPKYIDYKKVKNKLTGVEYEIVKTLECDFKIDNEEYDEFVNLPDMESEKILVQKVISSIESLDKIAKKIKGFDNQKFKADIETHFIQKAL